MKLELVEIDSLEPYIHNLRLHSQKNIDTVRHSLLNFGQQKPIVISNSNNIISGNLVWQVARELKWKDIWCVRTELTPEECIAYRLMDNRTAELGEWDYDMLSKQVRYLLDLGFTVYSTGFNESVLLPLLRTVCFESKYNREWDELFNIMHAKCTVHRKKPVQKQVAEHLAASGQDEYVESLLKEISPKQ